MLRASVSFSGGKRPVSTNKSPNLRLEAPFFFCLFLSVFFSFASDNFGISISAPLFPAFYPMDLPGSLASILAASTLILVGIQNSIERPPCKATPKKGSYPLSKF
jgi:C4-dicarboxylate transporter